MIQRFLTTLAAWSAERAMLRQLRRIGPRLRADAGVPADILERLDDEAAVHHVTPRIDPAARM